MVEDKNKKVEELQEEQLDEVAGGKAKPGGRRHDDKGCN